MRGEQRLLVVGVGARLSYKNCPHCVRGLHSRSVLAVGGVRWYCVVVHCVQGVHCALFKWVE